jgi:hypothetical protein
VAAPVARINASRASLASCGGIFPLVVFGLPMLCVVNRMFLHGKTVRDNAYSIFNNCIAFWNLKYKGKAEFCSQFGDVEDCDQVRYC